MRVGFRSLPTSRRRMQASAQGNQVAADVLLTKLCRIRGVEKVVAVGVSCQTAEVLCVEEVFGCVQAESRRFGGALMRLSFGEAGAESALAPAAVTAVIV